MGLKDPHDPREIQHFAQVDATGTVVAIVEICDQHAERVAADSAHRLINITDIYPYDLHGLKVNGKTGPLIKAELRSKNRVGRG